MPNINFENIDLAGWTILSFAILLFILFLTKVVRPKIFQKIKFSSLLLRLISISCLVLAICKPFQSINIESDKIRALIDISDSIDANLADHALKKIKELSSNKQIELFAFGNKLTAVDLKYLNQNYAELRASFPLETRSNSNLELALYGLNNMKPQVKTLLLFTDAQETLGSTQNFIEAASKFKIYPILPIANDSINDQLEFSYFNAKKIIPVSEKTKLNLSFNNPTSRKQTGSLTLLLNNKSFLEQKVSIPANSSINLEFETPPIMEGPQELQASLEVDSNANQNLTKTIFISGKLREKVLLLNGTKEDAKFITAALTNQAYELKSVLAVEIQNNTFEKLDQYSTVIFNNIPLNALPVDASQTVKNYVSKGGSFMMLGGNNSFGLGGYRNTSIEDILPVHLLPPEEEKKRLNIAVQLVLDKSGSMKEESKIEYSKAAAQEVILSLKPDDYIGIIGFDSAPFELFPMSPVGQAREKAMQRVELMFPGTTTNLLPALDLGKRRLESAKAGRKHLIILTDGKLPDGSARRPYYLQMVDEMRRTGITVSTFMIGADQDVILKEMAQVGGGAFHRTTNLSNLPRLFLEDIKVSTGQKTQKEGQKFDVRIGKSGIVSTVIQSFPPVLGYVQTKAKDKSTLELNIYGERKDDPLLASWQYEKGRTLAYTADVSGRWSYHWITWAKFQNFWSDILNSLRNDEEGDNLDYDYKFYNTGGSQFIETIIYSNQEPNNLSLNIVAPDKTEQNLKLTSIAKGHYKAQLPSAKSGIYTTTLVHNDKNLTPVKFQVSANDLSEQSGLGVNAEILAELAEKSGGTVNPDKIMQSETISQEIEQVYLQDYLLMLAVLLLLLEVASRESVNRVRFTK